MSTRALAVSLFGIVIGVGCVNQIRQAVAPEPESGGTLACRAVVEQCDSTCSDPLCLHGCSAQGTVDARAQHDTLLSCGETAGCTDEACIRAACPTELSACMGPDAPDPTPAPAPTPEPEPAPTPTPVTACGSRLSDWCPAPAGDPCGAHANEAACRADAACRGIKYTGESFVACHHDGKGFWTNCPTVGCISR